MIQSLLSITWTFDPEIFSIGSFAPRYYGLLFAGGFFLGYMMVRKMFLAEKKPEAWLDSLLIHLIIGTVVGARLGHVFFYNPGYYLDNPAEIFMTWKGGLASHGGTIGVLLALYLWSRKVSKQPFLWIGDRLTAPVALVGCFIRLGNLLNHEIIGKATDVPWAFIFTLRDNVPRHPAQLYESLAYLVTFIVCWYLYWKTDLKKKQGFLFGLFMSMIWGFRFLIEFFKIEQADFKAGFLEILTLGQWLSIPFVLLGIYCMVRSKNHISK